MEENQSTVRVTALMVARNSGALLRECLSRLEASSARERLEILVVDDGSSDDTAAVIAEFPSVISLHMPKRLGWTRAVNIALRTAKGDFIFFVPQEIRVRADTVARLADRLESDPAAGAVCTSVTETWRFPSPADLSAAWRTGRLPGAQRVAGDTATDYPQGAPLMTRRELLRAMNYLDKRFGHYWSDLEMCWRIRSGGKKIIVLPEVTADGTSAPQPPGDPEELGDSAHGAATWVGLHHGFGAGLRFRIGAALSLVGSGQLGTAYAVLSGSKIDGNQ
jgi:GT2 family glycosyltransferase